MSIDEGNCEVLDGPGPRRDNVCLELRYAYVGLSYKIPAYPAWTSFIKVDLRLGIQFRRRREYISVVKNVMFGIDIKASLAVVAGREHN